MMIDFHPDVVAVRLNQIKLAREAESAPSDKSNEKASASDFILAASTTIYNLNGQVGLSVDKPGTLLDAYLETKITIQDQLCLLISNLTAPEKYYVDLLDKNLREPDQGLDQIIK